MNILLTSVGRRSYLVNYFKEVLGDNGKVFVSNSSDISPAFEVADGSVITPIIYSDDYIPFLKRYCIQNNITAIISLFDIDLPILSKNKKEFEKIGVKTIVSDYDFIKICNDKWKTYNYLKDNNFNVPLTLIEFSEVIKCIENKTINYPIIIKPRWGMGSISVYEADNNDELIILYKKVLREIKENYLKYESFEDLNKCVLFQEKLIGQEYGLDVINDLNGNFINTIVKKKIAMRSGETDCAITVDNNKLQEIGAKLSKINKHIANLDVDVFEVNNKYYVLEMNARFGGGYPFSHIAGVNLPYAIVKWLNNEDVEKECFIAESNVIAHKDINLVLLKKLERK